VHPACYQRIAPPLASLEANAKIVGFQPLAVWLLASAGSQPFVRDDRCRIAMTASLKIKSRPWGSTETQSQTELPQRTWPAPETPCLGPRDRHH
jgi:hypothetical protein